MAKSHFSKSVTEQLEKIVCEMIAQQAEHIAERTKTDKKTILDAIAEFKGEALIPTETKGRGKSKSAKEVPTEPTGDLTIITDYGPKSHAIFGVDTIVIKDTIFQDINKKNGKKLLGFTQGLAFGPGWTIMDKDKLDMITKAFDKAKLKYKVISRKDYEKSKKEETSDDEAPKKTKIKNLAEKDGKKETKENKKEKKGIPTVTNAYGNEEDEEFGFVIMELPVGTRGLKKQVVIGSQDSEADAKKNKGIKSVVALTPDEIESAKDKGWSVLDEDALTNIKKKDVKLYDMVKHLVESYEEENEDE